MDYPSYTNISAYYDDFPNFKSFWGNIFINNFDSLANYKVFIRGELARNHIDTIDVGGITKSYLYSDFIKYSIYTHDMNRINDATHTMIISMNLHLM